jgi:hypothetical protein
MKAVSSEEVTQTINLLLASAPRSDAGGEFS